MTIDEMIQIKEERGYSFAQLSDYSGVPLGTIQKIFNGVTKHPRQATLNALYKVLKGEERVYTGRAYSYHLQESLAPYAANGEPIKKDVKEPGDFCLRDYYRLPEERRVELVDGVFYDMSAPGPVHQSIVGSMYYQIVSYIRENKGGCKVFLSPTDVQLDCDDRTMVEPDLLILCDTDKLRSFGVYGAPDFVLEILSPSSSKRDRFLKTYKYSMAGVREYWIIDPKKKTLTAYNFMEEEDTRTEMPLAGSYGMAIFDGELMIDLDEIAAEIIHLI